MLIASAPTPLGVAISTGGKAKVHEAKLTEAILSALESDRRYTPVVFPEEPSTKVDKEAALAALSAGRDAFMLLEGDAAARQLRDGTRQLLLAYYQGGAREGRDEAWRELLDAWAQRVGVLSQLGESKEAKKVAATLASLDDSYTPQGVEFVGDDATALITAAQKAAKRKKKGKLQVPAAKKNGARPLVRVDGEEKGQAPLKIALLPGLHVVELHAPGAKSIIKIVEVTSRKTARVKDRLELSRAVADTRHDLSTLDLTRPGYQKVMGYIGARLGAPEVLLVTFRDVGSALQLRARRVGVKTQTIRGASKTVVNKNASDLDEALLFALEEVLLGDRFEGGEPAASEEVAAADPGPPATPAEPVSDGASTAAEAEEPAAVAATDVPAEAPSDDAPSEEAPVAEAPGDEPTVASVASPVGETEAEEEGSGAALYLGAAGAAGGVGALLVIGVGAAVLTAVALQGVEPSTGTDPHRTGTTWTATGLVY